MNEFIVWDKSKRVFYDGNNNGIDVFILNQDGTLSYYQNCCDGDFDDDYANAYYEAFKYIGKTDDTPEQNKIYADCSIVEFDYVGSSGGFEGAGYFTYNKLDCRYYINTKNTAYEYNRLLFKNLKVIGTLQENPELLKDNNEKQLYNKHKG